MWPRVLLFRDRGTRRGRVVSSTPRPLFTPREVPVSILQEAGWAPGPVWTGWKSHPHLDSIPDRQARSSDAIPTELPGSHFKKIIPVIFSPSPPSPSYVEANRLKSVYEEAIRLNTVYAEANRLKSVYEEAIRLKSVYAEANRLSFLQKRLRLPLHTLSTIHVLLKT